MNNPVRGAADRRILVVDNQIEALDSLKALLKVGDYAVITATSGEVALTQAMAEVPDVIVLNTDLGNYSGYDICDRLKQNPATRPIPVLFISDQTDSASRIQAFRVGAVDFVSRSVSSEELFARIDIHTSAYQTIQTLKHQVTAQEQILVNHQPSTSTQLLELMVGLAQAVNAASSFDTALDLTLHLLGQATGWVYGEAWVEQTDGRVLTCSPCWYRQQCSISPQQAEAIDTFRRFSESLTLAPGEGFSGRVWQKQAMELIGRLSNVNQENANPDHVFLRATLAEDCGFQSVLSLPLLAPLDPASLTRTDRVLAVLTFFSCQPIAIDDPMIQVVSMVTAELGRLLAQKQAEVEMRALFAAMTDVVMVRDALGRCLRVAPTSQNMLYLPLDEIVGKTLHDVMPPSQAEHVLSHIRQSLREHRTVSVDYAMVVQGKEHWYAASIAPLTESLVLMVAREISDRIETEQALAKSQNFLDSIFENIPLALFVKDVQDEFRYVLWNRGAEAIYGVPRHQILGHTPTEIWGAEALGIIEQEHKQLLTDRQLIISDELTRFGVRQIWQHVRKLPLLNDQGDVTHLMYIAEDISIRKKMEEALLNAEANFRSIFENAVEGIYQVTPEGRFLQVNQAMAETYGYLSPEDMLSKVNHVGEQLYAQPYRWQELTAYLRHAGEVSDFESKVHCQDGSTFWVSENVRAVTDAQGQVSHYEGMVQDITNRRQADEELRQQRQRAEHLLLNVLPQPIAERLKKGEQAIADSFTDVSVLFADLVNFTNLSANVPPSELVSLLSQVFSVFDDLCDRHGLEKIKTIGDAYMAVGGLPKPRANHAEIVADMALDMQAAMDQFRTSEGYPLSLRIGIHTGSVVAGVIGKKKFIYDLWGDTVNIASRMESQGTPGRIQITAATYQCLKEHYQVKMRGTLLVKGRGRMQTYWLMGKNSEEMMMQDDDE